MNVDLTTLIEAKIQYLQKHPVKDKAKEFYSLDSMQIGQHCPIGLNLSLHCKIGHCISSQTTFPLEHKQVTQGFGDHTVLSNIVIP